MAGHGPLPLQGCLHGCESIPVHGRPLELESGGGQLHLSPESLLEIPRSPPEKEHRLLHHPAVLLGRNSPGAEPQTTPHLKVEAGTLPPAEGGTAALTEPKHPIDNLQGLSHRMGRGEGTEVEG